jgi:hypothetical protein
MPGYAESSGRWQRSSVVGPSGWPPLDRSAAGRADTRLPPAPGTSRTSGRPAPPRRAPPGPQRRRGAVRDPAGSQTAAWSTAAACLPAAWPAGPGASAQRSGCARTRPPPRGSAAATGRAGRRSSAGPGTPPDSHARPALRSAAPGERSCGPAGPARSPAQRQDRPVPHDHAAGQAPAGQDWHRYNRRHGRHAAHPAPSRVRLQPRAAGQAAAR